MNRLRWIAAAAVLALVAGCAQMLPHDHDDHGHGHEDGDHGHGHEDGDHGHGHEGDDHGHAHEDDDHGHAHEDDDHGHAHEDDDHGHAHEDDDHGHGEDGISFGLEQQRLTGLTVAAAPVRELRPSLAVVGRLQRAPGADTSVTAPVSGRVAPVGDALPTIGQAVEAGSVLLALVPGPVEVSDPALLDLAVEQASIEQDAAQREVDRLTPLVADGFVPERRLSEAQRALSASVAALRSARRRQASLAQAQQVGGRRDALDVPVPQAGVVASVSVAAGSWVAAGDALFEVSDPSRLLLEVEVPVAYASRVRAVSGAWFRVGRDGAVIEVPASALTSVGTRVESSSQTLPVRFRVEGAREGLFAGAVVEAHLALDRAVSQVAVPRSAIIEDEGISVVFVQRDAETFTRQPVLLGVRDGDHVGIVEGVDAGDRVVTSGAYALKLASAGLDSIGHGHAH
jgi:membrane fusion protein, heavy metal efflux system